MVASYLGDLAEDQSVTFAWNTFDAGGASVTRATDGTVKVRRDDGTDCTGSSVTDSEDTPDTGIHEITINTSDSANFAVGYDYTVWVDGAVVDGQIVNAALATFSIENRFTNINEINRNADLIESQRGSHTWQGDYYYVDPVNGDTHANGNRGGRADPYKTLQDCHDNAVTNNNHDVIFLVSGAASGATTHTVAATTTISKSYVFIRGPGRNFIITRTGSGDTLAITGDGVEVAGARIGTAATGSGDGVDITDADFAKIHHCWFLDTQGDGVHILRGSNCRIHDNDFDGTGVGGSGDGVHIVGTAGSSSGNSIFGNEMHGTGGDAILIEQGTTNDTLIYGNDIHDAGGWGINIGASSNRAVVYNNVLGNNSSGDITDSGTNSIIKIEEFAGAYAGPRGPGVYLNDAAGNTNTVDNVDGTLSNPVSTIGAAKTIADSLGFDRIYLVNNSSVTLAATMEDYEFVGIGEMSANTINFGSQDVDNSTFWNLLLTGAQGGTGRCQAECCVLSSITGMEITALGCLIADGGSLTLRDDCAFDSCFSAVAGTGTPTLNINSVANVNVYWRHYSGGLKITNAVATTVMSYESDGQLVIDATCTSLAIVVRGNCTITDNGTTTDLTQDAAINRTNLSQDVARIVYRRRVLIVDKLNGNDANSGLGPDDALEELDEAVDNHAAPGDLIILMGSNQACVNSVNVNAAALEGLEIWGCGRASYLHVASGVALILDDRNTLREMRVESDDADALRCLNRTDVTIIDSQVTGAIDGVDADGSTRFRAIRSHISGGDDGLVLTDAVDWLLWDTIAESTGGSVAYACAGVVANNANTGGVRGGILAARRDDAANLGAVAIDLTFSGGPVLLDGVSLIASQGSSGQVGSVVSGVSAGTEGGTSGEILLVGCNIRTINAGAGDAYDLQQASGTLVVANTKFDRTKIDGVITDEWGKDSVVTEARLAELDAANLPADIDQIKSDLPNRPTKNTSLTDFPFFMTDSSDHISGKTGLAITATRSIDGGAFAACANAAAEVDNGVYKIDLDASDLNGDVITFMFAASGADSRLLSIVTQP